MPENTSDIFDTDLPGDKEIAAALGLEDLRIGRHYLSDGGCLLLDSLWKLHIQPTFNHYGLLCVACSHGEKHKGSILKGWSKCFFVARGSEFVSEIDHDPLPNLLAKVPLLSHKVSGFYDGIGYQMHIDAGSMKTSISFANPIIPELIAIEETCWKLGENIARQSKNEKLLEFSSTWQRYLERNPLAR